MDIAQKVAQRIKDDGIKPIPKTYFVVRHVLIWSAVAGTVVLTGIACGVMVYLLRGREWGVRAYTGDSFFADMTGSIPYFWFSIVLVLLGLAVVNSHWLRRGYSVRPIMYFGMYGVLALLVGVVIAETGKGARIEEKLASHIPAYDEMVSRPDDDWFRPEFGLIAGHVVEATPSGIVLRDCHGGQWIIDDMTAEWRCGSMKRSGERIKLIGVQSGDGMFRVNRVLPWDVTLAGMENCIRNRALTQ